MKNRPVNYIEIGTHESRDEGVSNLNTYVRDFLGKPEFLLKYISSIKLYSTSSSLSTYI